MGPMLVVTDIRASKKFYEEVLGQKVGMDHGENVAFRSGFALQEKQLWAQFIGKKENEITNGSDNFELYFEEKDFDKFICRLRSLTDVRMLNDVTECPWGQRVVRFYDPDGHLIEVGENMRSVVKRFLDAGMPPEEASQRSMYRLEFVLACAEENKKRKTRTER